MALKHSILNVFKKCFILYKKQSGGVDMIIENTSGINESLEEIGARIRNQRIASHFTQDDLARRAGISLSSVRRIEQGQSVQFDTILRVLKVLNLLSKMEVTFPVQQITPMQRLQGEQQKKIYRKPKNQNKGIWKWGE